MNFDKEDLFDSILRSLDSSAPGSDGYMQSLNKQVQGLFLAIERNCPSAVWRQYQRDCEHHRNNQMDTPSHLQGYIEDIIAYGLHRDPQEIKGMLQVPADVGELLISAQNEPGCHFLNYPCRHCGCLVPIKSGVNSAGSERIYTSCPSCGHVKY